MTRPDLAGSVLVRTVRRARTPNTHPIASRRPLVALVGHRVGWPPPSKSTVHARHAPGQGPGVADSPRQTPLQIGPRRASERLHSSTAIGSAAKISLRPPPKPSLANARRVSRLLQWPPDDLSRLQVATTTSRSTRHTRSNSSNRAARRSNARRWLCPGTSRMRRRSRPPVWRRANGCDPDQPDHTKILLLEFSAQSV